MMSTNSDHEMRPCGHLGKYPVVVSGEDVKWVRGVILMCVGPDVTGMHAIDGGPLRNRRFVKIASDEKTFFLTNFWKYNENVQTFSF
jgi:hypothetical protein